MRMPHRAAHDPAQHITAPFVAGHHPVGNQERHGAQVVGNHPVMGLSRPVGVAVGGMGRCLDQGAHQVGVVIVMFALQQRADPFQPHAGVNRLHIKGPHRPIGELFILHEHVVPDLDKPVAIFIRRSRRATGDMVAVVIENLGAGAAGAGRAHPPEIIIGRNPDNPVLGQTRHLFPDRGGLVIGMVNGNAQLVLVQGKIPGQQLPGKGDRLILEIIAKAEITQHFKEGMVPRGIADIVQIIMFAARPHAFLRCRRPLVIARLNAGKQVFELHHTGIGEHQRRVIARHEGGGGHNLVPVARKEIEIGRADVRQACHGGPLGR